MRVVLGSDHAGFEMKQKMLAFVRGLGHEVMDVGTHDASPADYPDYAEALATTIVTNQAERGIMICGSGVGATIAVNKVPGIRGCVCHDCYSARQGVDHDNMNVLVLGARVIGIELACELVRIFLDAQFSCEERHLRRISKLRRLETKFR